MRKSASMQVEIIDDSFEISLAELCRCCMVKTGTIIDMVDEGLLEPAGRSPEEWRFTGPALRRVQISLHLQRDLHVNLAGTALAIELMEEIEELRNRLEIMR